MLLTLARVLMPVACCSLLRSVAACCCLGASWPASVGSTPFNANTVAVLLWLLLLLLFP